MDMTIKTDIVRSLSIVFGVLGTVFGVSAVLLFMFPVEVISASLYGLYCFLFSILSFGLYGLMVIIDLIVSICNRSTD